MNFSLSDSDDSAFLITSEVKKHKNNIHSSKIPSMKLKKDNNFNESIKFISNQDQDECENENSANKNKVNENFSKQNQENNNDKTDILETNYALTLDEKLKNIEHKNFEMKKLKCCSTRNLTCPLCLKTFDVESVQVSHMKQCAKKKKITTKQLLEALENQKKQLQNKTVSSPMLKAYSSSTNKKDTDLAYEDSNSIYQLALGLTLSKSISDNVKFNVNSEHVETHNVTLKKFGFTSSISSTKTNEKRKLKGLKLNHYSLKKTTKEERERLITEKAAVILLAENDELDLPNCDKNSALKETSYLLKYKNEETYLWNMGENENNSNWYVEDFKEILLDDKNFKKVEDKSSETSESNDIKDVLMKLNLPRNSISSDWKKLINNRQWSDLIFVTRDSKTIYMHSVVLYARCPEALNLDLMSKFSKFDFDTVFLFLQYLYCGILDGLDLSKIENLFNLAQFLCYKELIFVLNILKKNLLTQCNRETCNNTIPDNVLHFLRNQEASQVTHNLSQNKKIDEATVAERKISENTQEIIWIDNDTEYKVQNGSESKTLDLFEQKQCENIEFAHEDLKQGIFESEIKMTQSNVFEEEKGNMQEENDLKSLKWKVFDINQDCTQEKQVEKFYSSDEECLIKGEDFHKTNQTKEKNVISYLDIYNHESDMFEDAEHLDKKYHQKFHVEYSFNTNISPVGNLKNKDEGKNMVVSTPSDTSKEVIDEDNDIKLPEKDHASLEPEYEIPFFDPYEHFNTDLTDLHSAKTAEEQVVLSQSLFSRDISNSTAKEVESKNYFSRNNNDSQESEAKNSPIVHTYETSGYCSTPKKKFLSSKSSYKRFVQEKRIRKPANRRKLCEREILKSSSRLSMKYKFCASKNRKKAYEMKNWKKLDRGSKNSSEILTKSMINEFNNSFQATPVTSKTPSPSDSGKKFIEVTPNILPGEEFTENNSPVPDYSVMGASTIKKHLSKYGLKKNLSKNNAKKILRHIYEELHPVLNVKTGKIVKCLSRENTKKDKKCGKMKIKRNTAIKDGEEILEKDTTLDIRAKLTEKKIKDFDPESDDSLQSPGKVVSRIEDDSGSYSSLNLNSSAVNELNSSESELEKQLTQISYSDAEDVYTAIYDFIQSNPELRQKILTYEPIWLEEFQSKLHEKYKKKFKLSDIMDYLDLQCISFRHKRQKNRNIKMKRKSKKNQT